MTVLLFEYGHSKINTWNGRWAGEDKIFAKEVFLSTSKRERLSELGFDLRRGAKKSFTHDFGDGWVAEITMTVGAKKDFKEVMKHSEGFMGYEWIIDSILKHGKIVKE